MSRTSETFLVDWPPTSGAHGAPKRRREPWLTRLALGRGGLFKAVANALALRRSEPGQPRRRTALAIAILLVAGIYPDVLFNGASLSLADYLNVAQTPRETSTLLPERPGRGLHHGMSDAGGGAFQSEPAQQFMTYVIRKGESPFWNPYSATGAIGPESLIDLKFSPVTIGTALLGGGNLAFHAVLLGFTVFAAYAMVRLATVHYGLSRLAGVAAATAYLLNGYYVANVSSNVAQVWLHWPPLLLGLHALGARPRVTSFIGAVLAGTLFVAATFLPTLIMTAGTVLFVAFLATIAARIALPPGERFLRTGLVVGLQTAAVVLAIGLLGFLYLPIAEALSYFAVGEFYGQRVFHPASWANFVSVFTPKHVWEIYNAINPEALAKIGNHVFHQGIAAAIIGAQAVRVARLERKVIVIGIMGLLVVLVARAFGVPGLSNAFERLPVIGSIGEQYLWAGISPLSVLLVGFGVDALRKSRRVPWPALVMGAIILAALAYTYSVYGLPATPPGPYYIDRNWALFYVAVALTVTFGTVALVFLASYRAPSVARFAVLVLMAAEFTFYVNHQRSKRLEMFSAPTPVVAYLRQNAGLARVSSFGPYGLPPEYGSAYQLHQIGSMNFNILPHYFKLFTRTLTPNPDDRWHGFITLSRKKDSSEVNTGMLSMLGVRYVLLPKFYSKQAQAMEASGWSTKLCDIVVCVLENPSPYPRAFAVRSLMARDNTPVEAGLPGREVAFSQDPKILAAAAALGIPSDASEQRKSPDSGEVTITKYRHTRVKMRANLPEPAVVVLMDAWHPNWRATVDGRPAPIGIVNEAFRGIALPAGSHEITMSYRPATLPFGLALTGICAGGMLLAFAFRSRLDARLMRLDLPEGQFSGCGFPASRALG